MGVVDWLIVIIPTLFVLCIAFYSRRYVRGVVDFLCAGRLCGRYLLTVGDIANGISIVTMISWLEMRYRTGFAVGFWGSILLPVSIFLTLSGYCIYRFRETKAQSLGQFLEMRYGSRKLRFFASGLRTTAEILAHSIMPAIAARFFIYFLNLPEYFNFLGLQLSTFVVIMVICLALALTIICCGGILSIVLTDTIQGIFCMPLMVFLVIFFFTKFDFMEQMLPVLSDRISGESFLDPYKVQNFRDFNLFAMIVSLTNLILHRATWLGGGASGSAYSPHEQKMAAVLGQWRGYLVALLYISTAVAMLVLLNHKDFSTNAHAIRGDIAYKITEDIVPNKDVQTKLRSELAKITEQQHIIGQDKPLSDKDNLDTIYIDTARKVFDQYPEYKGKTQEFRTIFNQMRVSVTMRHLLGTGIMGLFALLMILAMVSTDDTYIFSSSLTIVQDLIIPFFKNPPSPKLHMLLLKLSSVFVALIFFICSLSITQLDYIELFRMAVLPMYLGGCGPIMVFGLYGRFGTRQAAWTSLLSGMVLSLLYLFVQRNWASFIYPQLLEWELVPVVGNIFSTISSPFNPFIVWEINPDRFPINSYESFFIIMIITLALYLIVSYFTCKEPFNLDRMLHRGEYNVDGTFKTKTNYSWKHIFNTLAGITDMHTKLDKIISWTILLHSYIYSFCLMFLGTIIWNIFDPWDLKRWGWYFLVINIIVPAILAAITTVWFLIGAAFDIKYLFTNLKNRPADNLDNGMVVNGVSANDYKKFDQLENKNK